MTREAQNPSIRLAQVSLASKQFAAANAGQDGLSLMGVSHLLQDISFEAFRGNLIAVVGPSGAGKTSLLRLLNRLSDPTRGTIYFNEQPLSQISVIQLRQQIVLVLQESKLLGMTVRQALEYPLTLQHLDRKAIQRRIEEGVERLHIPTDWLDRTELQLSVGQRQIVAIVRALVMHPKVLLLDEPTSALDVGRAELLLSVLHDISQEHGTTVLMVNHQLDLAEHFCNRVLLLQQGRLVHNLSREQVNWKDIRQELVKAEAEQVEEWG